MEILPANEDDSINGSLAVNAQIVGTGGNDFLSGTTGNDTISGLAGNDTLSGDNGNDSLNGGSGNDSLDGGQGNDNLVGGRGNDFLDGGFGLDSLAGGSGNDTYFGDGFDNITEAANAGIDTVLSFASFTLLGNNLENLTLLGSFFDIDGNGNELNNIIKGSNTGHNHLNGNGGNDTLSGGQTDDTLLGGDGIDILNGGLGNDNLAGENGDDTYLVDSSGDTILEAANAGIDTVRSSISFSLGANLENLTLEGGITNIFGIGNTLNNIIKGSNSGANSQLFGNDGNDTLIGGLGQNEMDGGFNSDLLIGGASNDTLFGQDFGDTLIGNGGNDSLNGGERNDSLNGGEGDDTLIDNSGSDTLIGGNGNDVFKGDNQDNDLLTGGGGNDEFYFGEFGLAFGNPGTDTITDFTIGADKIVLRAVQAFSALQSPDPGDLLASEFGVVNSDSLAGVSSAKIVYNSVNGNLFYNPDGVTVGFGIGGQFATLIGSPDNLSSTDFHVSSFDVA